MEEETDIKPGQAHGGVTSTHAAKLINKVKAPSAIATAPAPDTAPDTEASASPLYHQRSLKAKQMWIRYLLNTYTFGSLIIGLLLTNR